MRHIMFSLAIAITGLAFTVLIEHQALLLFDN